MRIWHKDLLNVLPKKQFLGQNRELIAIMRDWRDKGKTNHILINKVMDYPKSELFKYYDLYYQEYSKRGYVYNEKLWKEFKKFAEFENMNEFDIKNLYSTKLFENWHNDEYLIQCLYNLQEKYYCNGISEEEWEKIYNKYEYLFIIIKGVFYGK
jgi:uncharacterized protein (TIGR02328 family)